VIINIKFIHYSIRYKLLLKCDKTYHIWSKRLKIQAKMFTGLAFSDHPVHYFHLINVDKIHDIPQ